MSDFIVKDIALKEEQLSELNLIQDESIENIENETEAPILSEAVQELTILNEEPITEETQTEEEILDDTTDFEIPKLNIITLKQSGILFESNSDEGYLTTISSSEEIKVTIEHSSRAIVMNIRGDSEKTTSEIFINGFSNGVYKYEDNYTNGQFIQSTGKGEIHFTQDISKSHIIFLQVSPSTYILTEDGWSPTHVGTWNPCTRIATITEEGNQTIDIQTSNVILNGEGCNGTKYKIDGNVNKITNGIFINGKENITISNFEIENCQTGIRLNNCDSINISECLFSTNIAYGIFLDFSKCLTIKDNTFTDNGNGIYLNICNNYVRIESNIFKNGDTAIYLGSYNNYNTLVKNTLFFSSNTAKFTGIYIGSQNTQCIIGKNHVSICDKTLSDSYFYLTCLNISGSHNKILNNKITIKNNKLTQTSANTNAYINGILTSYSLDTGIVIGSNEISIENNSFISIKPTINFAICGINMRGSDTGLFLCENNKILIKGNKISKTPDSTESLYLQLLGIYLGFWNGGTLIKHNTLDITENSSTLKAENVSGTIAGVYISSNNTGTYINNNTLSITDNSLGEKFICSVIYLDSRNNGNEIRENNIKLLNTLGDIKNGIYLLSSNSSNSIINNFISNCEGTGITLNSNCYSNTISKNSICGNSGDGIVLRTESFSNIIDENLIKNNGGNGILLDNNNDGSDIFKNKVTSNGAYGVLLNKSNDNNRIRYNVISNNFEIDIALIENNNGNKITPNYESEIC